MRRLKTRYLLILLVLVVAVVTCGTVYAYMFKQTENVSNQFVPAEVTCEVHETLESGATEKSAITVTNTGDIDAYLRVRLVSYWVQSDGSGDYEIVAKASEMPTFTLGAGWIAGSDDTYYYTTPVEAGNNTTDLLESNLVLTEEDGYLQVVEVFAEAIQSKPDNSVTESWGVTLDANGTIISVVP